MSADANGDLEVSRRLLLHEERVRLVEAARVLRLRVSLARDALWIVC